MREKRCKNDNKVNNFIAIVQLLSNH